MQLELEFADESAALFLCGWFAALKWGLYMGWGRCGWLVWEFLGFGVLGVG